MIQIQITPDCVMYRILLIRRNTIKRVYFWACASILWTYMSVSIIGVYKSWYIATACVLALTVLLFLNHFLNIGKVFSASGLLLLYFFYLFLTAFWAESPMTTIWFVSIESIFIFIFILFYLLSLNFSLTHLIDFFVELIPPATIIFIISHALDPEATRMGYNVLPFLPFLSLFVTWRLLGVFSVWNIILLTACLLMLVMGMSRTPLIGAAVAIILTGISVAKRWTARLKLAGIFIAVGLILSLAIVAFQPIRLYAAKTLTRVIYQDVVIDEQKIEAEEPDIIRLAVFGHALLLYKTNWLFGIGYMNFMPLFGEGYDYSFESPQGKEQVGMSLHNSFQTWALEGGVPCVVIVALLMWKYFSILKGRIRESKSEIETSCYKCFLIAMICLLVMGLFHQVQQMPILYILLGTVYALDEKRRNDN
jgi:O-antigen ligase